MPCDVGEKWRGGTVLILSLVNRTALRSSNSEGKREVLTVDRSTVQIYCFPVIFAVFLQL